MRFRQFLLLGGSIAALLGASDLAFGQTPLPEVLVKQPKPAAKPAAPVKKVMAHKPVPQPKGRQAARPAAAPTPSPTAPSASPEAIAAQALAAKTEHLNQTRQNILPRAGANSTDLGRATIAALPQGDNAPIDKVLLQAPGVSQDSATSGALHVRNEHANVQYRINGVFLPDGVSGFGQIFDSGLVGNIALIDGALPAQYGLHTAGIVDIRTRSGGFDGGGSISLYGGSLANFTPSVEYGGTIGDTQYFFTGRYFNSNEGIENPTPNAVPIHDHTEQGKFFGYVSTLVGDGGRFSFMTGSAVGNFQIPNNPNQPQVYPIPGFEKFNSSQLNEHQLEQNYYNVAAYQQTIGNVAFRFRHFPATARCTTRQIRSAT